MKLPLSYSDRKQENRGPASRRVWVRYPKSFPTLVMQFVCHYHIIIFIIWYWVLDTRNPAAGGMKSVLFTFLKFFNLNSHPLISVYLEGFATISSTLEHKESQSCSVKPLHTLKCHREYRVDWEKKKKNNIYACVNKVWVLNSRPSCICQMETPSITDI